MYVNRNDNVSLECQYQMALSSTSKRNVRGCVSVSKKVRQQLLAQGVKSIKACIYIYKAGGHDSQMSGISNGKRM